MELDQIICGDNVAVLGAMPGESVDLVVTSPPYDNLRKYSGAPWDFDGVARELARVLKPGGVIVWVVADATVDGSETGTSFRQALHFKSLGLRLHDTMIWLKPTPAFHDPKRYGSAWEYMFVLSKGAPKTFNPLLKRNKTAGKSMGPTYRRNDRGQSVVSTVNSGKVRRDYGYRLNYWPILNSDISKHPAVFPEALARDHILSWSAEGDTVLDPFNGSGTTCKVARDLGRNYIGIDVSAEYCDLARQRLAQGLLKLEAA
jgi:DNA modification methylase